MNILIAYDGSIGSNDALEDMRRAGLPQEAEALVVCVSDGGLHAHTTDAVRAAAHGSWREKLEEAQTLAEIARTRLQSYFPRWTVLTEALWGSPAKIILETSGWWHPNLLVVGSHGHSRLARLFLGSVSAELVHKAHCSVRLARPGRSFALEPIRIIIGNDGSPEAGTAIQAVAERCWPETTEAYIVSVVETLVPAPAALEASTFAHESAFAVIQEADKQTRERLRDAAKDSADRLRQAGLIVTANVVEGDPRQVIVEEAHRRNADAIFVGARGLSGLERLLLGSVSTHVLTHAHCSVEVIRG
jgi:nucleotide-binding universal stress UspA family protein